MLSILVGGAQAQSPLKIATMAGFNGHAKPGRWLPVRVTIDNQGTSTEGMLTLRFAADNRTTQSYAQVSLPNTSRKQIFLYALTDESQGEVRLNVRGVQPTPVNIHFDGENDHIVLVISSEGEGGLSYIGDLRGVGRPLLEWSSGSSRTGQANASHVVYAKPGELPDRWVGYDSLDAIVLQNFTSRDFTAEQVKAVQEWVAGGGTLVVTGGTNYQRLTEGFVADLLPVKVAGTKVLPSAPRLQARYGGGLSGGAPLVVAVAASIGRTPAAPEVKGRVIVEENGIPLIAVREFGAGRVVYLAFDPVRPPIAGWQGSSELWRDILLWTHRRPMLVNAYAESNSPMYYGGYRPSSYNSESTLSSALMNIPSMQAPPFGFIGMFLCLYIFFLVPVNYFVLKKMGKRELAWVTTPFIVVIFTLLSYSVGFSIKGGTLRLNQLTVVQSQAGGEWGAADTMFGVFSPSKTGYSISAANGEGATSDLLPERSYSSEPSDLSLRQDQQWIMEDYRINMWAMKLFRARSVVKMGKGVTAQFQMKDGALVANVRNGTPFDFQAGALIAGRAAVPVSSLAANQNATVQIPANFQGDLRATVVSALNTVQGSDAQRNARNAAVHTLLHEVSNSGAGAELLSEGAVFIGLTANDTLPVNVAGRQPQVERSTLVVVRLPLDLPSTQSLPSESFVPGRIIESNVEFLARSQQAGGAVQLEPQQYLVYEFRLPIRAARGRVDRLNVRAQFSGAVGVSAYNFSDHTYHALGIQSSGDTHALSSASPYVLLPDGIVRVRVQARTTTHVSSVNVGIVGK
jgi:hypothetical protein